MRTAMLTLLAAGLTISATAQTPTSQPPQSPASPTVQKQKKDAAPVLPKVQAEVVVTASRYEQESFATPVPIDVVSEDLLSRVKPEKVMDLLKQLPGVDVSGEGPFRGLPVIRGLSSNRVLILVDGQRLNNSRESTQFAGIQPGLVDLSQVERIEVLRGPASVLYGSDALGGVINIITRQQAFGQDRLRLSGGVNYEYGSASQSHRGGLELNGAAPRATFHIGAGYFEANDYSSPKGEVPNSGMTQKSLDGNLRFMVGEAGVLRLDAQSTRTSDVGFPGYDPKTSGIDIAFPRFDRDKYAVTYEGGPILGLGGYKLSAYVQNVVKESRRNISFGSFFSNNFTRSEIDSTGASAQSTAVLGNNFLVFGLDFYQDKLHDETTAATPFGSDHNVQIPDATQRGVGLYVQDEIQITDRFQLMAGARGDRFSFVSRDDPRYKAAPFDVTDSALSGSLSARYQVTPNVALTALVGRAYRAPNIQERAYFGVVSDGTTYVEQNPDLHPETALNAELGFKVRYDRYSGGFNVYRNTLRDFITLVIDGKYNGTPLDLARFQNIAGARIEGAELNLQAWLSAHWTAFGSVAYSRGTDERTNEPLPLIAPLKGVLGARYEQARWWGELATRMVRRNDRVATGFTETPGFATYDLRAGYRFAMGLSLQAALENLSDKAYHEPFNTRFEPGRSARVSVGYRF
ncbi:MAG TPA: TonB-dependent receptor [Thermoanaerobaculaceae bacterium]|nr:TonB-dependent receptor [Thermoanaerobaculaceae bacterium]